VFSGYGSDGLTLAETGSPTALLTVPTRYTHTAFETVDPRDLEATVELLRVFVTSGLPARP
jgi:tetrahedral aminopeptidase